MSVIDQQVAVGNAKRSMRECEFWADFTAMPNGVPTVSQSGHTLNIYDNGLSASGMTVTSGKLVHGNPTASNSASYMEVLLARPWERMGFRALFPGAGKVAMIPWADPGIYAARTAVPQQAIPVSPTHSVFGTTDFHISKWTGTAESAYLVTESFPEGLDGASVVDGSFTWELYRDGNTVYCRRPDGRFTSHYVDPDVTANIGRHACIELYEPGVGVVPAQALEWWVD